jgi:hypothetical protein
MMAISSAGRIFDTPGPAKRLKLGDFLKSISAVLAQRIV